MLQEIEAITTLEQVRPLGEHIKELSENPNVNLCGDDLPTLRNALTVKRDAIKAQLESVKADSVVEAETVDTSDAPPSDIDADKKKLIESDLIKSISAATLQDADKIRAVLYSAKAVIGDAKFDKFDAMLDAKLNDLADSTTAQ